VENRSNLRPIPKFGCSRWISPSVIQKSSSAIEALRNFIGMRKTVAALALSRRGAWPMRRCDGTMNHSHRSIQMNARVGRKPSWPHGSKAKRFDFFCQRRICSPAYSPNMKEFSSITCFKIVNLWRVGFTAALCFCVLVNQNMLLADATFQENHYPLWDGLWIKLANLQAAGHQVKIEMIFG